MGEAVPHGQRPCGRGKLHGSPASAKSVAVPVAHRLPSALCRQHLGHHGMALEDDFPRRPHGIVVRHGSVARRARCKVGSRKKPLHGMGFPQGVDAPLPGALAVVVARCMKGNMGVSEVMPQVGCSPHNLVQVRLRTVRRCPCLDQSPVAPFQLPRQDAQSANGCRGVCLFKELLRTWPRQTPQIKSFGMGVVEVEVVPWRFEAVRVLARIGVGGAGNQRGGIVAQGRSKFKGQGSPRFGVEVSVGDKSPRRHHKCDACNGKDLAKGGQTEALSTVSWFNRTKEPFFRMGIAVQLLGVKQYFTSSFKLSLRSLRR